MLVKVVFVKNLKGQGIIGQIKNVPISYAENYLIKNGFAQIATNQTLVSVKAKTEKKEKLLKKYKKWSINLQNLVLVFNEKADETGTLFAGVTISKIAKALKNKGYEIPEKFLSISMPIKKIGTWFCDILFSDDISTRIKIEVIKNK